MKKMNKEHKLYQSKYVYCKLFQRCEENGDRTYNCEIKISQVMQPLPNGFLLSPVCPKNRKYCCAICPDLEKCEFKCKV